MMNITDLSSCPTNLQEDKLLRLEVVVRGGGGGGGGGDVGLRSQCDPVCQAPGVLTATFRHDKHGIVWPHSTDMRWRHQAGYSAAPGFKLGPVSQVKPNTAAWVHPGEI